MSIDIKRARKRLSSYRLKYPDEVRYKITDKDLRRILTSACASCGIEANIVLDHIVPLSRGGYTGVGNLQALCANCNNRKGGKLYSEFRHNRRLKITIWQQMRDKRTTNSPRPHLRSRAISVYPMASV
jgi:5-methylcytosine-specific restriction endonuclease McrA